jgi:hypothetical protein
MGKEFMKYPGIPYIEVVPFILNNPVYVFEKLDGGNCQVRKIDGRIIPGSRSNFLEGNAVDRIVWFKDFVSWANTNPDFHNLDENFVIFGEWLAFHNIMYDSKNMNQFYFLDIYDIEDRKFVPYDEALAYLDMMGINVSTLRVLQKGLTSLNRLDRILHEPSDYRSGNKEGIIIKDYATQQFAKMLHPLFSEKVEGERILPDSEKYVTFNRWRKTKEALIEEGKKLTLENIISRIVSDIEKGHGVRLGKKEIYERLKELDLHNH